MRFPICPEMQESMTKAQSAEHPEPSDVRPVAEVLARIQTELEEISGRIDKNQALIARSTRQAGATNIDYLRAMQDADLAAQRVAGLASYLREIAAACDPLWRVDTAAATATLTLAEMARAMSAPQNTQAAFTGRTEAGEVDLF